MASMKRKPIVATTIAVLLAAALLAGLWWASRPREPAAANEAPREAALPAPAASSSEPAEPAIRYPVDTAQSDQSAAPLDFRGALDDLFGARTVASTFLVDDFARRFVATIDNLGRSGASSRLWPVVPAAGRFSVAEADGAATIAAANAARYESFVRLIEGVDLRRAAGAYGQLYPSLQRAYEELGYPKSYFNDRFVSSSTCCSPLRSRRRLPRCTCPRSTDRCSRNGRGCCTNSTTRSSNRSPRARRSSSAWASTTSAA